MNINLGDKVKDRVSGFTGIVTGKTEWLNGCRRVAVQSDKLKDGLPTEAQHFDIEQVDLIKAGAVARKSTFSGGPMPSAPRASNPSR